MIDFNFEEQVQERIGAYDLEFGEVNVYSGYLRRLLISQLFSNVVRSSDYAAQSKLKASCDDFDRMHFSSVTKLESDFKVRKTYRFDEKIYLEKYVETGAKFAKDIVFSKQLASHKFNELNRYMYVVKPDGELRWFAQPINAHRSLCGTRSKGDVVHPMLLNGQNLEVACAGEFLLIESPGSNKFGLYVDNFSGHFRPFHLSSRDIKEICLEAFKVEVSHLLTFSYLGGHSYELL